MSSSLDPPRAHAGRDAEQLAVPLPATTPRTMRRANRATLLDAVWGADRGFTASDLMALSGLTRATVLQVCRELQASGWIRELPAAAGPATAPGRQALRFGFQRTRHHLLGADIGRRSLRVAVADLGGRIVGRASRPFAEADTASRAAHLEEVAQEALLAAGLSADDVAAACIGVAAPVAADGGPVARSWFWESVSVDAQTLQDRHPGWRLHVENDANLAALAEASAGGEKGPATFVTLLSGERLGAGLILSGRLHRGAQGAAGEMEYLEHVSRVHGSQGIASLARTLAAEALAAGRPSALRPGFEASGGDVTAVEVLRAAEAGDGLAAEVVTRIGERIALTILTIANVVDPSMVVIAGGIAGFSESVLQAVRRRLPELLATPPDVVLSTLGRDVVLLGALKMAADEVRAVAVGGQD